MQGNMRPRSKTTRIQFGMWPNHKWPIWLEKERGRRCWCTDLWCRRRINDLWKLSYWNVSWNVLLKCLFFSLKLNDWMTVLSKTYPFLLTSGDIIFPSFNFLHLTCMYFSFQVTNIYSKIISNINISKINQILYNISY